jgi:type IV secretory pathway TraG/TraD family ATPase VirD4
MDLWLAVPSAFAIETFLKNNDIYGKISWATHSQQSAG